MVEDQSSDKGPLLDLKIEGFSGTYWKRTQQVTSALSRKAMHNVIV